MFICTVLSSKFSPMLKCLKIKKNKAHKILIHRFQAAVMKKEREFVCKFMYAPVCMFSLTCDTMFQSAWQPLSLLQVFWTQLTWEHNKTLDICIILILVIYRINIRNTYNIIMLKNKYLIDLITVSITTIMSKYTWN